MDKGSIITFIIAAPIIIYGVYMLVKNVRKQSKGECSGCSAKDSGCSGCK